jgi:hypothetical protein
LPLNGPSVSQTFMLGWSCDAVAMMCVVLLGDVVCNRLILSLMFVAMSM